MTSAKQTLARKSKTVPHTLVKGSSAVWNENLRTIAGRSPGLLAVLRFLFGRAAGSLSFHDLKVLPILASHRNTISEKPFFLAKERFGGSEDVALVPLIRHIVDETLRAYAHTSPYVREYIGKTPISPYGSMGLSVSRWGYLDWDYIRDLDWRIFLPPQIGHLSGFKTDLERTLTTELHKYGLYPVLFGKDERGLPQVQLREVRTQMTHGFHFFLVAMKPGFVRGNLHRDGGYSPHYAYFPEHSLDEYLQAARMQWSDVIQQQREDYVDMFNQLSFNIFGENSGDSGKLKTPGWYLHKAFKWYATLARVRGLPSLEEDLMYQYEHFRGSEAELSYLARYRYYAHMAPSPLRMNDLERDLARVASVVYAQARNPEDPLVGQQISGDSCEIALLEAVPRDFATAARKLLAQSGVASRGQVDRGTFTAQIRFADHLQAPCRARLPDGHQAILVPAKWSIAFSDSYIHQVLQRAAEENRPLAQKDVRQALVVLLASLLCQALTDSSSLSLPSRQGR